MKAYVSGASVEDTNYSQNRNGWKNLSKTWFVLVIIVSFKDSWLRMNLVVMDELDFTCLDSGLF